jgi:hypothetical protein
MLKSKNVQTDLNEKHTNKFALKCFCIGLRKEKTNISRKIASTSADFKNSCRFFTREKSALVLFPNTHKYFFLFRID